MQIRKCCSELKKKTQANVQHLVFQIVINWEMCKKKKKKVEANEICGTVDRLSNLFRLTDDLVTLDQVDQPMIAHCLKVRPLLKKREEEFASLYCYYCLAFA